MTTLSADVVTQAKRLCAHWPALLLAALAAEMIGLVHPHRSSSWAMPTLVVLLVLSVAAVGFVPAIAAKVARHLRFLVPGSGPLRHPGPAGRPVTDSLGQRRCRTGG